MADTYMKKFKVGEIPDQRAPHGFPLVLCIDSRGLDSGTLNCNFDPAPQGQVVQDSETGAFFFDPAKEDRAAISATFSAKRGGADVSQTISIVPVPELRPERDVIRGKPVAPDPLDTHYFKHTITSDPEGGENHVISGMKLVIGGPEDRKKLHQMYHVDRSSAKMPADQQRASPFRSLTICVDHLVIHDALSMPETDIGIYAREITFEGQASIDTSPLAWAINRARSADETGDKGADGINGRKAGNIRAFFDRLNVPGEIAKRFVLTGGQGQHAGEGKQWIAGTSYSGLTSKPVRYGSTWPFKTKKTVTAKFNPSATYVKSSNWDGSLGRALSIKAGDLPSHGATSHKPTSATGGQPPGVAGDGGDAGQITSNRKMDAALIAKTGGACGKKASDVRKALGGRPVKWGHYQVYFYYTAPDSKGSWSEVNSIDSGTTSDGPAHPAPAAKKKVGLSPDPIVTGNANSWLHPYLLQVILRYARDAYLADQIDVADTVLSIYRAALDQDDGQTPPEADWDSDAHFETVKTEVGTLLHRIASHLDYFGNPVGWTPFFSLQTQMQMYDDEVDTGLQTLLMTRWVGQAAAREQGAVAAMDSAIKALNADTAAACNAIEAAEDVLRRVDEQWRSLRTELLDVQDQLERKREALRVEASNDALMRARINFGAHVLGAICTVVPVGQPVLGAVGSLAPVIASHATARDSDPIDAVGDGFNALGDWSTGAGKDGFASWATQVAKEAKPNEKEPTEDEQAAKTKADQITHVGKNIGPALNQIGDAFKGLKVPESEIEAEIERLAAESPEYREMIEQIIKLNQRKAQFVRQLEEALQTLASAYAQITANFVNIGSLAQQRQRSLAALDHQALLFLEDMEQRAKERLVRYQYYLIRAYEASAYKPYDGVDYRLEAVFESIAGMLEKDAEDQGSYDDLYQGAGLGPRLDALRPIFRGVLDEIEDRLKTDFQMASTYNREFRLSPESTPEIIAQLNRDGRATINLMDLGPFAALIPPTKERVRISGINVKGLGLGEGAPDSGSVELTFGPTGDGTIRSDGGLYAFRHPAQSGQASAEGHRSQLVWGTVYSLSDGTMTLIEPSKESLKLLGYLIKDPAIDKEGLAKPAAWTDIEIALEKPYGTELKSVLLEFSFLYAPLAFEHYTLDIRTDDQLTPLIQCNTQDVTGRSDGFGSFYRIFPRSSKVTLDAPLKFGQQRFSHWDVLDLNAMNLDRVDEPTFETSTDRNLRLTSNYAAPSTDPVLSNVRSRVVVLPSVDSVKRLYDRPSMTDCEVVGIIPEGEDFIVLNEEAPVEADGFIWRKVDFKGIVGWIADKAA